MNLDFTRTCRTCLRVSDELVDLFLRNGVKGLTAKESQEIIDHIKSCYNIQIQPDDVLPTKICHQCIQIVSLFFTSQRNAKQCDLVLKNYLLLRNFKNVQIAQIEELSSKNVSEDHSIQYESQPIASTSDDSEINKNVALNNNTIKENIKSLIGNQSTGQATSNKVLKDSEKEHGSGIVIKKPSSSLKISSLSRYKIINKSPKEEPNELEKGHIVSDDTSEVALLTSGGEKNQLTEKTLTKSKLISLSSNDSINGNCELSNDSQNNQGTSKLVTSEPTPNLKMESKTDQSVGISKEMSKSTKEKNLADASNGSPSPEVKVKQPKQYGRKRPLSVLDMLRNMKCYETSAEKKIFNPEKSNKVTKSEEVDSIGYSSPDESKYTVALDKKDVELMRHRFAKRLQKYASPQQKCENVSRVDSTQPVISNNTVSNDENHNSDSNNSQPLRLNIGLRNNEKVIGDDFTNEEDKVVQSINNKILERKRMTTKMKTLSHRRSNVCSEFKNLKNITSNLNYQIFNLTKTTMDVVNIFQQSKSNEEEILAKVFTRLVKPSLPHPAKHKEIQDCVRNTIPVALTKSETTPIDSEDHSTVSESTTASTEDLTQILQKNFSSLFPRLSVSCEKVEVEVDVKEKSKNYPASISYEADYNTAEPSKKKGGRRRKDESGKFVGTVIDQENILSPSAKRIKKKTYRTELQRLKEDEKENKTLFKHSRPRKRGRQLEIDSKKLPNSENLKKQKRRRQMSKYKRKKWLMEKMSSPSNAKPEKKKKGRKKRILSIEGEDGSKLVLIKKKKKKSERADSDEDENNKTFKIKIIKRKIDNGLSSNSETGESKTPRKKHVVGEFSGKGELSSTKADVGKKRKK